MEIVCVFQSFGWTVVRQRGSHIILIQENRIATLSVPNHKSVAKGTLQCLIRSADLTVPEFLERL